MKCSAFAVVPGKGSFSTEGQLHTVIEKSPESSPTTKPRQSGGAPQPPSPPEPSSAPTGLSPQSGRFILSTGMYPVPQPEPHVAQMPSSNLGSISSGVFPALSKQNSRQQHRELQEIRGRDDVSTEGQRDGRTSATQNGYHNNNNASSPHPQSSYSMSASSRLGTPVHGVDRYMYVFGAQHCDMMTTPLHQKPPGSVNVVADLSRFS